MLVISYMLCYEWNMEYASIVWNTGKYSFYFDFPFFFSHFFSFFLSFFLLRVFTFHCFYYLLAWFALCVCFVCVF